MLPDPQSPFSDAFAPADTTSPDATGDDASSPTGSDIVDAARKYDGTLGYKLYSYNNETPSGQAKDHHFIADTLGDAGLGFGDDPRNRPGISDWTDASSSIPGFAPVTDGSVQAGDVLASAKPVPKSWYHGNGQYLGIATGDGSSLGIVDNDRIGENQFGFQPGHNPVVWRSTQLADATNTYSQVAQAADTPPVAYPPRAGQPPNVATQQATTCMAGCLHTPLTVTGGREGGHSPGSAHATGQAVDLGLGSNPTLSGRRGDVETCFGNCFPPNSMGQFETNPPHYHLQTRPGRGGATGFLPGNR